VKPLSGLDLHVVCSDPEISDRIAARLVEGSLGPLTVVQTLEGLELGEADDHQILVVLAVEGSPTRRISIVRALAEQLSVQVVVCRKTGGAEVRRTIRAGANGYVLVDEIETALVPTVRAVLAGQLTVPRDERTQVRPPTLSTREKQVLGMVVMGYMNCDIAKQLFLAESTVKSHLSSAFLKLGVRSRNEAVELILDSEHGLGRGILAITSEQASYQAGA
jgi:DNA-binding NarL/FixJ family response regulator